jgi:tRNA modification GTPase
VLAVFAASEPPTKEDEQIVEEVKSTNVIYVMNKSDIACDENISEYRKIIKEIKDDFLIISAKTGADLDKLETSIGQKIKSGIEHSEDSFIADGRILVLLQNAKGFVQNSTKLLHENAGSELIAFELQSAIDSLNEITGEISPDDILESIFTRFCIGK